MCSGGSKWRLPSGRDYEHVEPSRCIQAQKQVKEMSDGMRVWFRILLAPRAGCLPTPRAYVRVLVLVLSCSRARARARVLVSARVLECSSVRRARLLVIECSSARVLEFSSCSGALVNVLVPRSCRARARVLVLVLECSRARARVLECW